LPLPLVPDVIVIQLTPSVAFQVQSLADEVTLILPVPPLAVNELLVGEME
jgi:hypothetical protein